MIRYRSMKRADCPCVAEIAACTLPEHWSVDTLTETFRYDYYVYDAAWDTDTGGIVGFAGMMVLADTAELLAIAVRPERQGTGIGKALFDRMVKKAWDMDAEQFLLEVREHNGRARALYAGRGFCEIDRRKDYYSNPNEDAVIMRMWRDRNQAL